MDRKFKLNNKCVVKNKIKISLVCALLCVATPNLLAYLADGAYGGES